MWEESTEIIRFLHLPMKQGGQIVSVRVEQISAMRRIGRNDESGSTMLYLRSGEKFSVRHTPEQILEHMKNIGKDEN